MGSPIQPYRFFITLITVTEETLSYDSVDTVFLVSLFVVFGFVFGFGWVWAGFVWVWAGFGWVVSGGDVVSRGLVIAVPVAVYVGGTF